MIATALEPNAEAQEPNPGVTAEAQEPNPGVTADPSLLGKGVELKRGPLQVDPCLVLHSPSLVSHGNYWYNYENSLQEC